jgi:flagellar hook-associated protein 3 FlgL
MRVTTSTVSANIVLQIQQLSAQQTRLQTQVATGQRIFQPEDDPAAVGRVLNLESEQRQVAQFARNASHALELTQASFSGLRELKKVADRATELGTLGSGVSGALASTTYASELNQLVEHALELANSRSRNDYLFGCTAVDAPPFAATRDAAGKVTGVAYGGTSTAAAAIQISETASLTPTTDRTTNLGLRDFINQLVALRDALDGANPTAIATAQGALLANENQIVSALAEHGGVQTRIEATQSQLQDRVDNLESLVSGETDTDVPSTIVKLNQAQLAYQAALQSAANIMKISLLDFVR